MLCSSPRPVCSSPRPVWPCSRPDHTHRVHRAHPSLPPPSLPAISSQITRPHTATPYIPSASRCHAVCLPPKSQIPPPLKCTVVSDSFPCVVSVIVVAGIVMLMFLLSIVMNMRLPSMHVNKCFVRSFRAAMKPMPNVVHTLVVVVPSFLVDGGRVQRGSSIPPHPPP